MKLYDLPDDNTNNIIQFLDLKYVYNLCCTNLINHNNNQQKLKKIIASKKEKISLRLDNVDNEEGVFLE